MPSLAPEPPVWVPESPPLWEKILVKRVNLREMTAWL
jgi:hypothetical protein